MRVGKPAKYYLNHCILAEETMETNDTCLARFISLYYIRPTYIIILQIYFFQQESNGRYETR